MLGRIILCILILSNCAVKRETIKLHKVSFLDLQDWSKDNHRKGLETYIKSCSSTKAIIKADIFHRIPKATIKSEWLKLCSAAKQTKNPKKFFEDNFTPFLAMSLKGERGLFTGYYEVVLEGSIVRTNKYKYPIYAYSRHVNTRQPRSSIDNGALKGKNLEIVYVADRVGLFFMHIQGSGKVKLSDGSYIKLGYAGQNHYPYFSIGNYLTQNNLIDRNNANAEAIIDWLNNNPEKATKVMYLNQSYVFFTRRKEHNPVGALGVEVTPMRSLAVDRRFIPLGMPLWLETSYPRMDRKAPLKPLNRIMVAQDVGGAIKGPVRGDIFFGSNKQAEKYAWYMANKGRYFLLLPKDIARYLK